MEERLRAFYRPMPDGCDPAASAEAGDMAAEALERSFARLAEAPYLPEHARRLFAAGAALRLPPDPRILPHALMPGEAPTAVLWNALLVLRARHAGMRAMRLAADGRFGEAADAVAGEAVGWREAPGDLYGTVSGALAALAEDLRGCDSADLARLPTEMANLVDVSRVAAFRWGADAVDEETSAATGPQLRRLLVVLEILQLARCAGIPLPPLEGLAPAVLADRLGRAISFLEHDPEKWEPVFGKDHAPTER